MSKSADTKIPRPMNSYIMYRKGNAVADNGTTFDAEERNITQDGEPRLTPQERIGSAGRRIGQMWRNLPPEEKRRWEEAAAAEKAEHKTKYPKYRYSPKRKEEKEIIRQVKKGQTELGRFHKFKEEHGIEGCGVIDFSAASPPPGRQTETPGPSAYGYTPFQPWPNAPSISTAPSLAHGAAPSDPFPFQDALRIKYYRSPQDASESHSSSPSSSNMRRV